MSCKEKPAKSSLNIIRLIINIHDDLIDTVDLINQCYSVQIMFYFTCGFGMTLMFVFNVITFKSYFKMEDQYMLFIANCAWNFYKLMFLLTIMYLGSATKNEGQKTATIVFKILNRSFNEEVDKKVFS